MSDGYHSPLMPERFWRRVARKGSCWQWVGGVSSSGYSNYADGGRGGTAHRAVYTHMVQPIPAGYQIDHLCGNRLCVNPAHLEAVTQHENIKRTGVWQRNAAATHCKAGHPFDAANTYINATSGSRQCRTCMRRHRAKWRARQA